MPKDRVMHCTNCAFYRVEPGEEYGRCHRYPPVMVVEEGYSFDFPTVNDDDFCGEFQSGDN